MSSDTLLDGHTYVFLGIHGRAYLCNLRIHRTVQNMLSQMSADVKIYKIKIMHRTLKIIL